MNISILEVTVPKGRVKIEAATLSGEKVLVLHFSIVEGWGLSDYREWKKTYKEILELANHLGVVEVLSFVPKNRERDTMNLQRKFGFEVIADVPEGLLTRSTEYDKWASK